MDLQTIKNNYAKEQGYEDWRRLKATIQLYSELETHMEVICIRAQKLALEKAAENANTEEYHGGEIIGIDRNSITNPKNLIL